MKYSSLELNDENFEANEMKENVFMHDIANLNESDEKKRIREKVLFRLINLTREKNHSLDDRKRSSELKTNQSRKFLFFSCNDNE